jgi:hypothetical protein
MCNDYAIKMIDPFYVNMAPPDWWCDKKTEKTVKYDMLKRYIPYRYRLLQISNFVSCNKYLINYADT